VMEAPMYNTPNYRNYKLGLSRTQKQQNSWYFLLKAR
jgi:hypothetical protein